MPGRLLPVLLALGMLLWVAVGAGAPLAGPAAGYDLALLLGALLDWRLVPPPQVLSPRRHAPERAGRGQEVAVTLSFSGPSRRTLRLAVRDILPAALGPSPRLRVTVRPGSGGIVTYTLTPTVRGRYRLGPLLLRVGGPLGLAQRQYRLDLFTSLWVHPRLVLGGTAPGLWAGGGLRRRTAPGLGREFDGIREHRSGEDLRLVNWKATARRARLMANEYRDERSQNVLVAVDTGRAMLPPAGDGTKLDQALEACLRLADAALARGDRVGCLVFADRVSAFLPPRGGRPQYRRLLASLSDVAATPREPDYAAALGYLDRHWRKRSLVVLFTDLAEPDASTRALAAMGRLAGQHLLLVATLRDPLLDRLEQRAPTGSADVYRQAVARQVADAVRLALGRLEAHGILTVHVGAARLGPAVEDAYRRIKQRAGV